jgi:hypothetical protein
LTDQQYEYQRFDLDLGSVPRSGIPQSELFMKRQAKYLLQPLGDDGWELTYVRRDGYPPAAWVEARRPRVATSPLGSWEYTVFNLALMPHPLWDEHIDSRGWTKVRDVWFEYYYHEWWVYKRTDIWRGSDDGDIASQLSLLGVDFLGSDLRFPDKRDHLIGFKEAVKAILDLKWRLSERAGHDIGTYSAVTHWVTNL